jgi:hypothetical protein
MAPGFLVALAAASFGDPQCFATAHEVPAGARLSSDDVAAVPCQPRGRRAALRYDSAARTPIAVSVLPAGTYLGRLMPLPDRQVAAGEPLLLRSSAGPVTIEREVTAMQPARPGARLFVRDPDGRIFAVRYAEDVR